jgi:thiol-disulfide isomerase/thioredoxin
MALSPLSAWAASPATCAVKVGAKAPAFELVRADGHEGVALKDALARHVPVVVVFWAYYCAACQWELPILQQISQQVGDKVAFLLIHDGPDEERMRAVLATLRITLPSASDDAQVKEHEYCVKQLPTTVILDAKGVVQDILDPPDIPRLRKDLVQLGVPEARG